MTIAAAQTDTVKPAFTFTETMKIEVSYFSLCGVATYNGNTGRVVPLDSDSFTKISDD